MKASRYEQSIPLVPIAYHTHTQSKLEALKQRSQFMPTSPMVDVTLQVCDISADASLETRYGMHVPVLTWFGGGKDSKPNHMHPSNRTAGDGGAEVELERPSPRVGADQLERHLTKHIARAPQ